MSLTCEILYYYLTSGEICVPSIQGVSHLDKIYVANWGGGGGEDPAQN